MKKTVIKKFPEYLKDVESIEIEDITYLNHLFTNELNTPITSFTVLQKVNK